jgi:molecular chaperone GrpE
MASVAEVELFCCSDGFIVAGERATIVDRIQGGSDRETPCVPSAPDISDSAVGAEESPETAEGAVPEPPEPLGSSVASVIPNQDVSIILAELRDLRKCFDSKIRYDDAKERQIEALHEELQGYRQGLYQQIMQPIVMDLIGIYDEAAGQLVRISGGPDAGLGLLAEMVEEVLARYGVVRYQVDSDAIDRSRQKVIGTRDTADPELAKRLARRVRSGFEIKGKVIRPEWVEAYRRVPDAG